MRILTVGDSWTYGEDSSDPSTMSWPAQMSKKYNVEVVNLAQSGGSNYRASRIAIEELCRDSAYDYVIFPLAPAGREEILTNGKYQQIWPNTSWTPPENKTLRALEKLYTECWHSWNDVQNIIMLSFYFAHSIKALGIPLYMTGLSLHPAQYAKELSWITNYKNDNDFNSLDMPVDDFNIGIKDLDRKLKSLKAIHNKNLKLQPEYFNDVISDYLLNEDMQKKYGYTYKKFNRGHPDDAGYGALADYFAEKIGLTK